MAALDTQEIRSRFPSLHRTDNGHPIIYLDGPGGTQVPQDVIDAISNYYSRSNANTHGTFVTTRETDEVMYDARVAMATLLGAADESTISFGQNMTTLNFALSRAIARVLRPGEEILITQLDHEANRGPWLALREFGIIVREVLLKPDGTLDYDDFGKKINEKTRLVAMGMSSNAIGTVNDVAFARKLSYRYGAWLLLDAVHYAPHFSIDVEAMGCDFLLCSAYKFYGPHVGILYSKPGLLDRLPTDRLRTADQRAPYSIETGTLNHAAIAGVLAAVKFIASLGTGTSLREKLVSAYTAIADHEHKVANRLFTGVQRMGQATLQGQDFASPHRTPTISFLWQNKTANEVCHHLARKNICAWDGHFYALRAIEILGVLEKGGITRLGISLYNTAEEVDQVLSHLSELK